jgi:hypothetical protein
MRVDVDADGRKVWVEIDIGVEPIAGTIHHGPGAARPFEGWLELIALLEAVCRPDPAGPP